MATGGPYSVEARKGFDPANAVEAASDTALAISGADPTTDTATRKTPQVKAEGDPTGGPQFALGVDSPMYGWSLSQEDLGQGQVQQIRTDQFVTPVAEQRYPVGAIAARQQAVATKREEVEKAKQKAALEFDPFKDISDPAAQHQYAFSNYLNKTAWPELVNGIAEGFGIPREGAIEWLRTTPEGRLHLRQWARTQDALAKESVGMTARAADLLARAQELKIDIPEEYKKGLQAYFAGVDENDVPISGMAYTDFLPKVRNADEAMSAIQFANTFMNGFKEFYEMHVVNGRVERLPGGRYRTTTETHKEFDQYKEAMAEEMARGGILGGDRKKIDDWLNKLIHDRVEVNTDGWSKSGDGSGSGSEGKSWIGTIERGVSPVSIEVEEYTMGDALRGNIQSTKNQKVDRLPIGQIVGGRMENMGPRKFTASDGTPVEMRPQYIERNGAGRFMVVGRPVVAEGSEGADMTETTESPWVEQPDGSYKQTKKVEKVGMKKQPAWVFVPVDGNEGALNGYLNGMDWKSAFGPTKEEADRLLKKQRSTGGAVHQPTAQLAQGQARVDEAAIKQAFPDARYDATHGWVAKDPATGKWRKVKL